LTLRHESGLALWGVYPISLVPQMKEKEHAHRGFVPDTRNSQV
jgi:hypothetical protein